MMLKRGEGITLIALIITIIILLILTGVIISSLTENGLFEKAKITKQKQTEAEVREKISLLVSEYAIDREQGKTLLQFLTEKKDDGEIDDFTDNGDGTFDIIINGYVTTITESNLNTTEPVISSDIMVILSAKTFTENKIQVLITVKSKSNGIKEIRLINNVTVQGNNKNTIAFDQTIEANIEYQVEVELTNGTISTKTIKYEDTEAPTAIITMEKNLIFNGGKIQANVNIQDNKSGVNIDACKWVAVQNSENLGTTDESLYTGGILNSATQTIKTESITEAGEYYIHLLLKDNVGNVTEVISEKVEVKDGYEISTPEEFQAIKTNLAGNYYITKDIDMEEFGFTPIDGTFTGTINGMGHKISNLTIRNSSATWSAIFYKTQGATIENIIFENVDVYNTYAAVIAYETVLNNRFYKVGITGEISGVSMIASFTSNISNQAHYVDFENCYFRGNITNSSYYSGGITGAKADGWVRFLNCYFYGSRTGSGGRNGPLANEEAYPSVENCFYNSSLYTSSVAEKYSGIGLTTDQFANSSNFTNWDFTNDWYINENGYPELKF